MSSREITPAAAARSRRTRGVRVAVLAGLIGMGMLAGCVGADERLGAGSGEVSGDAGAVDVGRSVREVAVAGETRRFGVYRPGLLDEPAALVLAFHGHGGSPEGTERMTGWSDRADDLGAVIVYPEGIGVSFNAGDCCGAAHDQQVDDVSAALAMIDDVATHIPIDPDRVYSTGFSNGASMSYRLACETDRLAAIGPVAGIQFVPCHNPSTTSVMHIHGLADTTVPAAGETRADGTVVRPLGDVIAGWRGVLDCAPARESRSGDARRSFASCSDGRAVELITLDHFGHDWPTATDGVDATAELARFFAHHSRAR